MLKPERISVASTLDRNQYLSEVPNDTGSTVMRRASSAIETIARLVGNSVRQEGSDEPIALSAAAQIGLMDALELIAYALEYEAVLVDDNAQVGVRRRGFADD